MENRVIFECCENANILSFKILQMRFAMIQTYVSISNVFNINVFIDLKMCFYSA
jgi:hypothetical protein